jgi:hypothetical protein
VGVGVLKVGGIRGDSYYKFANEGQQHGGILAPTQKSEIIAITYSAVVKQIFKIANSNADCNRRLFAM